MELVEKLEILSAAAKFDVSCSSSGSKRNTPGGGFGNGRAAGCCHTFTEDGRCISLLKILLSNACKYDCAYCINRKSNDVPRATFTVQEVVRLTVEYYRRNYIEGLFLSSAVIGSPDHTMEQLILVAKELREKHRFGGYIHLKSIPGASPELLSLAGVYADRTSVNVELPSSSSLKLLAPDKNYSAIFKPMNFFAQKQIEYKAEKKELAKYSRTPKMHFLPAGQTTQMIVGATPESDLQILTLSNSFYENQKLKRVYYSGYIPLNNDSRLPTNIKPPLLREHRLYQADWLMRFYGFKFNEIVDDATPNLDTELDPKAAWALRHPECFPVDLNTADYEMILRVPGIGVRSAQKIVSGRRFCRVGTAELKAMGVALNRAQYFIYHRELPSGIRGFYPEQLRYKLVARVKQPMQLSLFDNLSAGESTVLQASTMQNPFAKGVLLSA